MNKNILILGKGFIGRRLQKEFNCNISGSIINRFNDADRLVKRYKPKIIINCIGSIGRRNVDDCEFDKDSTLLANSFIPVMLAEAALRNNIKLVHISSGCIFNFDYKKDRPINEDSEDYFFKLFYSRSKIYSERVLQPLAKKYNILIVRTRIPLLNAKHPKNVLDKLIKYKKIIDIPNSVTYIPDFIQAIKHLIKIDARGIYNVVNKGGLRYPLLMKIYQKYIPEFKYTIVDYRNLGLVRTNLLLSVRKLERSGFKVRNINSVLEECVKEYLKS
ncbi:MAG: sugar nucleotide-binding protein [Candidatus Omnitrophica bacterium]|jgi:3,5-epimerase/4-reductase|nr:sugar nucleotide-binding protein [Candidatus Omnitrophota bacterium]MDD5660313.1 sugar nucleotide-binding protein [Candidatus Omnitrophota bacterium]